MIVLLLAGRRFGWVLAFLLLGLAPFAWIGPWVVYRALDDSILSWWDVLRGGAAPTLFAVPAFVLLLLPATREALE